VGSLYALTQCDIGWNALTLPLQSISITSSSANSSLSSQDEAASSFLRDFKFAVVGIGHLTILRAECARARCTGQSVGFTVCTEIAGYIRMCRDGVHERGDASYIENAQLQTLTVADRCCLHLRHDHFWPLSDCHESL
jgi:hypothetical protein